MSSSETRVLRMSMPALRALLRASPDREWTVEEIAAYFGVEVKTVKNVVPKWVGAASNVRIMRTPRGWMKGFRYGVAPAGFEAQFGPTVDELHVRIAALEAEVAALRSSLSSSTAPR